jgi:acyl carrier protein
MTDTAARVKSTIARHLCLTTETLPDDLADLGFDSLDQVELAMALEEELGCADISDEQTRDLKSITDWIDMAIIHIGKKGTA